MLRFVYCTNFRQNGLYFIQISLIVGMQTSQLMIKGAGGGGGGPRPKIIFNVIFVEGRQSYQMLFTGSKNIDPSRIYRIFKIAKYIQLPCGCTLYSRLSQNFKF